MNVGPATPGYGVHKLSPNGSRLIYTEQQSSSVILYDFDKTTGVVTNSVFLTNTLLGNIEGAEFSPDSRLVYSNLGGGILGQWDLCAGSGSAVAASMQTIAMAVGASSNVLNQSGFQLATNGKIYVSGVGTLISVIHNPNNLGAACGFSLFNQPCGTNSPPRSSWHGLPNFVTSDLGFPSHPPAPPFTHTAASNLGCNSVSFTAPSMSPTCAATGFTLSSVQWDFGDPASGVNNSSGL